MADRRHWSEHRTEQQITAEEQVASALGRINAEITAERELQHQLALQEASLLSQKVSLLEEIRKAEVKALNAVKQP